jgi:integrase
MKRDLTTRELAALSRRGQHRVSRSLYLQITPTGTRSWLFRYRRHGRPYWVGLGPIDLVTLVEARAKVIALRKLLLDGQDPAEHRRAARQQAALAAARSVTFENCAERYIKAHSAGWKNGKHRAQWQSTLSTYAYPVIGPLPVAAIDTGLIMQVLEPIWATKPETASRVRGRIESILDWAAARGYRQGDNPARWRGHLQRLLPARAKVAPVEHHAALPYPDMPAFMTALRQQAGTGAAALRFTILTATRTGEALGTCWDEIDLKARTWTVPSSRMKAGRPHVVPLSDQAIALLQAAPRSSGLVFEGARAGRPLSNTAMIMTLRRMGRGELTTHGFRSSFRDWAAEQTRYPNHVVEMALAHTIGDKVEAAYRRGDLLAKRRSLMKDWAAYCDAIS